MIQFDLPTEQSSILKVIGVGGGGGNAVNHMFSQDIDGVNFIICNTDAQAIANSEIPNKIQLGPQLTSGLGAGANPEIGRQATVESLEEIRKILEVNTKMAFITAGMGGGTGTGGAPIIAKICKDLGVLTVGIVTTPFAYEGKKRQQQAEEGINQLKQYVDTLLVISNDKLRHQYGNLKMREAFEKADNVLATAAKCITDVINSTGQINVDFADVCTVMKNGGRAILGNAAARGEDRAQHAIEEALNSPLLNDNDIKGAKWILININSAEGEHEFTMDEVEVIQAYLLSHAGDNTDVILGLGYDNSLGDQIGITLIATGFENKDPFVKPVLKKEEAAEGKIVMRLSGDNPAASVPAPVASVPAVTEEKVTAISVVAPAATPAPAPVASAPATHEPIALKPDPMAPKLIDDFSFMDAPMPTVEDVVKEEKTSTFLLSSGEEDLRFVKDVENIEKEVAVDDQAEDIFYSPAVPGNRVFEPTSATQKEEDSQQQEKEAEEVKQEPLRTYLSKPANIYAEAKEEAASPAKEVKTEEPLKNPFTVYEKEEVIEIEKTTISISSMEKEKEKEVEPTISALNDAYEEEEMRKRRQLERIQKLRNLSFNVNSNDPTDEFENVPAYIRRNMELKNNTSHIESYYSKFEVSSDDQNHGQINTINTFLDGKKPD
ncbi:cell division protein FtsZ [Niabella yanshanensis]|uniref:Cell division protein FtsZ n=1 Tax=Niabella yanshanensis TaxID=577386 RepID=A0ABZ0WB46_9BACT|nr:cell division protein FtsZ [Niabella yanshanensis]WQD40164.1 cell division protein FtsZ [Niabella yanshanensis]